MDSGSPGSHDARVTKIAGAQHRDTVEAGSEADRAPSGRHWISLLIESGWDPFEPSSECLARTARKNLDLSLTPFLSAFDCEGIHWRTTMLELNWYHGSGSTPEQWLSDWRRAAVLFVLRERSDETGLSYTSLDAARLHGDLERWYLLRFRRSLRRLRRVDQVVQSLVRRGLEERARAIVQRWLPSCEPALTAERNLEDRPHLQLDDASTRRAFRRAIRIHGDSSLFRTARSAPRELLTFLEFETGPRPHAPIVIRDDRGQPTIQVMTLVTVMRRVFADYRSPAAEVGRQESLDAFIEARGSVPMELATSREMADYLDRRELLDALDGLRCRPETVRSTLIEHLRGVVSDTAEELSAAELARVLGVDESTVREALRGIARDLEARRRSA